MPSTTRILTARKRTPSWRLATSWPKTSREPAASRAASGGFNKKEAFKRNTLEKEELGSRSSARHDYELAAELAETAPRPLLSGTSSRRATWLQLSRRAAKPPHLNDAAPELRKYYVLTTSLPDFVASAELPETPGPRSRTCS